MKIRIIQPEYSINPQDAESCFGKMLALMDSCNFFWSDEIEEAK